LNGLEKANGANSDLKTQLADLKTRRASTNDRLPIAEKDLADKEEARSAYNLQGVSATD
jgi:hypothetical protein